MIRGILGIIAGLLLVTCFVTYGGIGINAIFFSADRGIPLESVPYRLLGIYAMAMALCQLGLGTLLLLEYTRWQRTAFVTPVIVSGLLVFLGVIHFAAITNVLKVNEPEMKELFIDSSILYPMLVFVALLLYWVLRRTGSASGAAHRTELKI